MSKTHSLSALAAGVCILALACWVVAGAFPLSAAPQVVADGPGVTVDLGSAALVHRPSVQYPEAARAGRIEGTVVVEATLDSAGNPIDARVLSGPQELRKAALQSVLQWHFARGASVTQVSIAFKLPVEGGQPESVGKLITNLQVTAPAQPADSQQAQAANRGLTQEQKDAVAAKLKEMEVLSSNYHPGPAPTPSPEMQTIQDQMSAIMERMRDARSRQDQQAVTELNAQLQTVMAQLQALKKITGFKTSGISEQASRELLASLPVHTGDAATTENFQKLTAAVKQFDEHLSVGMFSASPSAAEVEVRITAPGSEPAGRITVGGQVQEASLIKKVLPMYPPAAREVRIQGHVILSVIIAKDGSMQEIKVKSGHPMLAPAAMEAVRQWQYKPTLLNGSPVEVSTEIDVNFTLGDAPPAQ